MQKINLETYKRRALFDIFQQRESPVYTTTFNLDITEFYAYAKHHHYKFSLAFTHAITCAANEVPEFKQRILEGELYQYNNVAPTLTVARGPNQPFSFCDFQYRSNFKIFHQEAIEKISHLQKNPSWKDTNRFDILYITFIPWFSFTSFTHPIPSGAEASIPVFTVGKYFDQNEKKLIPLALQINHAVIDGQHIGAYFECLSALLNHPAQALKS